MSTEPISANVDQRPRIIVGKKRRMADFSAKVEEAVKAGHIIVSASSVEVPADTSKVGKDLKGDWKELEFKSYEGALAYFDGKEDSVLDAIARTVNTVRKQTARQKLINDAMNELPEEDRKLLVAATALKGVGDFGNDVDAIVERLKAQNSK